MNGSKGIPAKEIDLRGPARYTASVDWIRNNVVLKSGGKGPALQLNILVRDATVTLYMNPANHYIMGFLGRDTIYILDDQDSPAFLRRLQSQDQARAEILKGLSSAHHSAGLGTFKREGNRTQGSVFSLGDLESVRVLPAYSRRGGMAYDILKRPLSLLVCMLSESARIPMMELAFEGMYFGRAVVADEAIQSYDDAKYLIALANKFFPLYARYLGVEKLQKRANELDGLLKAIGQAVPEGDRKRLISDLLSGRVPAARHGDDRVRRFCDMVTALQRESQTHIGAAEITQLISTCKSECAVRAAMQGVVFPDV